MTRACPICQAPLPPREQNAAFPFCSPRCKLVDLGKWLDGEYRIPVAAEDDDEGETSAAAPPDEELA